MNGAGDQIKLMSWYAQNFGVVVKKRGQHDAADMPATNLTFGVARTAPTIGAKRRSVDHVGFEVENLEAFCKNLEGGGGRAGPFLGRRNGWGWKGCKERIPRR